jgi:hypothetical protein
MGISPHPIKIVSTKHSLSLKLNCVKRQCKKYPEHLRLIGFSRKKLEESFLVGVGGVGLWGLFMGAGGEKLILKFR